MGPPGANLAVRGGFFWRRSRPGRTGDGVSPVSFEELTRLPVIGYYEAAFRKATGVPLKIVPAAEPRQRHELTDENAFCSMMAGTPNGCEACRDVQARAHRSVAAKHAPCQIGCFAGLTDVAVPVMIGDRHVATLLSGQVFRREATERDFALVAKMLGKDHDEAWLRDARQAYFATPVVTADRFQAIIQLLGMFAQFVADFASRQVVATAATEPAAVTSAKEYVQAHLEEPITLERVVAHVGVSRFYFCKLFKKSTGLTLTEYVARVRIEKAKSLLVDPSLRVSEIAYAAGFGSIPQFNSVFKRYLGMAPTDYRDTLRRELPDVSVAVGDLEDVA